MCGYVAETSGTESSVGMGEPFAGSGTVTIVDDGVAGLTRCHAALYRVVVEAAGIDEDDVFEVRVSEAGCELDVVDFADPDWPIRTVTVQPASAAGSAHRHPADRPGATSCLRSVASG
jgi:hypothetical protein